MDILFLTAATGGGHIKAAQALMQQMERRNPQCGTRLVDSLTYVNPFIDKLITGTYLHTIKRFPGVYGRFYDLSEKGGAVTDLVKGLSGLLSRKFYSLFEQNQPDAVVCAHTMPLQMMASLKRKGLLNVPVIGIVTDYTSHSFWKLEEVDAFIVANGTVREEMIKTGIHPDRVYACGIPVSQNFLALGSKSRILESLGFEKKPTLLLMGGSLGFGELESIFKELLALRRDMQIIAVAGCNNKLRDRLESLSANVGGNVKIFGFTDRISELMDISDLLITKPGGITVSEALVKKLPMLITKPIPGQEERNARFLLNAGAAMRLEPHGKLGPAVSNLLDHPALLRRMSAAAAGLARPAACEEAVRLVEGLAAGPVYSRRLPVDTPFAVKGIL
jgi:processive 1,2-diacylglycerol beta-glucosyltransferase